jgi:hypothetical protein
MVEELPAELVDLFAVDLQGRTALHIAAENGHRDACSFLRVAMRERGRTDPVGPDAPVGLWIHCHMSTLPGQRSVGRCRSGGVEALAAWSEVWAVWWCDRCAS